MSRPTISAVDPLGSEAAWCLEQYYAELDERFEGGFDLASYPSVSGEELFPPRGVFLVALAARGRSRDGRVASAMGP
ncbi:MAG: hypothetical protein ACE5GX_10555, partial [Thermoanaerobaculia bacterium]